MNVKNYIASQKDNMIADLKKLVEIRSVRENAENGYPFGKAAARALEVMLEMCADNGLYTENTENYIGTADFYRDKELFLGILCHVDTVPECNGWTSNPFELTERGGRLYGRGTIDDKGPAIAVLYAIKALKELDMLPNKNVRLIFGTDEECGSGDLDLYRKNHDMPPMLITPDGAYPIINCEKGLIRAKFFCNYNYNKIENDNIFTIKHFCGGKTINAVPDYAEAEICGVDKVLAQEAAARLNFAIGFEFAEKDGLLTIKAHGKTAHASLPENGRNAASALIALLSELDKNHKYSFVSAANELFPCGETDGHSCGIRCADKKSGPLTAVMSVVSFDGEKFEAFADIRVPADFGSRETMSRFSTFARARGFSSEAEIILEPHYVPDDSPLVKTLLEVYSDVTGKIAKPHSLGGLTYVHGIKNSVAFGAEDINDNHNMHGADEFIETELLMLNAEIYANAIMRLCKM